ncbi:DUF4258 domain-containing protein [Roseicella aquatilis]|nr:DUF4258 domain-containing protein [Roseicella aquatilis]
MIRPTTHATERMQQYGIAWAWVLRAVTAPDRRVPDPRPGITRSFRVIPERGGRILRVAHRPEGDDALVLSAHVDRGAES